MDPQKSVTKASPSSGDMSGEKKSSKPSEVDHVKIDIPPSQQSNKSLEKLARKSALREVHTFTEDLLSRTVEDAVRWAYGIVAVEIWALREEDGKLYRPKGGQWLDASLLIHDHGDNYDDCATCQLADPNHPKYINDLEFSPGVGKNDQ